MGNLSSQASKQANVCLNVVAKYLTEKHGYVLKNYEPTEINYESLLQLDYDVKTIIQFGDLYLFSLAHDTLEQTLETNCIIEPFIRQICTDVGILHRTKNDKLDKLFFVDDSFE